MAECKPDLEMEYVIELLKRFVVEHSQLTADKIVAILDEKFSAKFISKDACEVRRKEADALTDKRFKLCITISLVALGIAIFAAGLKMVDVMLKLIALKTAIGL